MSDDKSLNQPQPSKEPSDYYLTAPVEIPTPEQMKVKLVPSHLLTRLEETRSDENRWNAVTWAFVGAILGFIADFAISGQTIFDINRGALAAIIAFGIIAILAALATWQFRSRAERARREMVGVEVETKAQLSTVEPPSDEGGTT